MFAVTLTLIGTEVLFRSIDFPFDESWVPSETKLAQFDPELGWVYIPETTAVQEFGDPKRSITMNFDGIGARAHAADRILDPSLPTVLLVGGSFIMGHGVPYEESAAGFLAATLTGRFQVINLGVQGYGTDQAFLMLKRHIGKFNVRAVVYAFFWEHVGRNANDDRRLLYRHARFAGTKPMFALADADTLVLKKRAQRYEDLWYSRVWALLRMAYVESNPPPALELTKRLVLAMKAEVESSGAAFIVVDWDQECVDPEYGDLILDSLDLNLIDTEDNPPSGWCSWIVPGDGHPAAVAHAHVAALIRAKLLDLSIK